MFVDAEDVRCAQSTLECCICNILTLTLSIYTHKMQLAHTITANKKNVLQSEH